MFNNITFKSNMLDKYAIASIFYICLLCVWHSIVGSNWPKDFAKDLDKWLLIFFCCLFFFFHVIVGLKFYVAYKKIRNLKSEEFHFLQSISHVVKF